MSNMTDLDVYGALPMKGFGFVTLEELTFRMSERGFTTTENDVERHVEELEDRDIVDTKTDRDTHEVLISRKNR